jgi:glucan biosynthesis protein C
LLVTTAVLAFDSVRIAPYRLRPVERARAAAPQRTPAFDYLRAFVIGLVVLHHAIMAYCTGGQVAEAGQYMQSSAPIVDTAQWEGFNWMVVVNDSFFMPLMFLLSGLFVQTSLARKGLRRYLGDRLMRLGIPLVVGILAIVPLAYYASYLQSGGARDFGAFWLHMVTAGPWPSGPIWFVGALLVIDAVCALLLSHEKAGAGMRRLSARLDRLSPTGWFAIFLALSALAYLPALLVLGPSLWLTAGPFGVQASRIGLYAFYFVAGALVGADRLAAGFGRRWLRWPLLAALATALFLALHGATLPAVARGAVMLLFSAAAAAGLLALAVRFGAQQTAVGRSLGANAYGIYLAHYPIVLWIQYGLLHAPLDPVAKGLLVLVTGFGASWLAASLLRRVPGVARVV